MLFRSKKEKECLVVNRATNLLDHNSSDFTILKNTQTKHKEEETHIICTQAHTYNLK